MSMGKPCPYCGAQQYADRQNRNMQMMFSLLLPLPVLLPAFVDVSPAVTISILIGTYLFCSAVYPFLLRLNNKEESWKMKSRNRRTDYMAGFLFVTVHVLYRSTFKK